ncbi:uncharacterized protein N0V89_004726 [Didymosphaeria variabile]|uniref:Thioredoxin-like protein n=1 Tax=Didymosphaeria variabile TaxID=1932322 RepID=A0A9W8XT18_9PLEO|nr:uncharacterized protein N0V89_004726 [Didymosphaeria variabile]KAJ4356690.1 hypothetical protein N0V89_004726 [Didymosphaeria variabile]
MTSSAAQEEYNELFRDKGTETRHPEDRNNDSDRDEPEKEERYYEHDDPAEDTDEELGIEDSAMRSNNYHVPSIRSEANTGPKGVIADAAAFEKAKKQARRFTWKRDQQPTSYTVTAYHDEKLSSDDEEDGFMKQWREARRRIYGNMPGVDGEGFLEAIEKVARDTVVVVFIYDDTSEISAMVEEQMREVARRNDTTRFVKLHYEDAEMEVAGVPAVIAYRNSDKFAGLVPLMDELPEDSELTAVSLETVFRR